jgi:hypothetical protein
LAVIAPQALSTVTDSLGNTWLFVGGSTQASTVRAEIWRAENSLGGANTVTYSWPSTAAESPTAYVAEWSGADTSTSVDQVASTVNAATSTHGSGGIATPAENSLVLGIWSVQNTFTVSAGPTGYSTLADIVSARGASFYKIKTDALSEDPVWTSGATESVAGVIATFKEAAAGAAGTLLRSTVRLLGLGRV